MSDLVPDSRRPLPEVYHGPPTNGAARAYAPAADADDEVNLREIVAIVRRHLGTVLLATLLGLGIAAIVVYMHVPQYRSRATVRVLDIRKQLTAGIEQAGVEQLLGKATDPLLSQIQVMRSRTVMGAVVADQGLQLRSNTREFTQDLFDVARVAAVESRDTLHLDFGPSTYSVSNDGKKVAEAPYGAPVHTPDADFTVLRKPAVARAELFVQTVEGTIDQVARGLRTTRREGTDLIDIDFTDPDRYRATTVVQGVVEAYSRFNLTAAREQSRRRRIFIEEQLGHTDSILAHAQLALSRFRASQGLYSPRAQISAEQTGLYGLDVRREELAAEKRMYEALIGRNDESYLQTLLSSPGIMQNPLIAQLATQLSTFQLRRDSATTGVFGSARTNPDVARLDTLIASTQDKIVNAVRSHIASIDARLSALDDLRRRSAATMSTLPTAESEEARLVQQVEIASKMSDQLRAEYQLARIAEAVEAGQVEVLDQPAIPRFPLSDHRELKLALGLILGMMFGAGTAVVREHMNTSIRRRDELEELLQLPSLAVIPSLSNGNGKRRLPMLSSGKPEDDRSRDLVTISDKQSSAAEAYRTLRTNLLFAQATQSLRIIAVTSALPAEGKTTTAANLATTYAQQGLKVLLVDCDLRKSQVHRTFAMTRTPGFTEITLGQVTPEEAIRKTDVPGLYVLPSGIAPPSPAELLGSETVRRLFEQLSADVDIMIVDAPPVLLASDASVLARLVDGMILVVRAGQTDRVAAQHARQQLVAVGANVIGAVLNDPDAELVRYGSYYGEGYYGDED